MNFFPGDVFCLPSLLAHSATQAWKPLGPPLFWVFLGRLLMVPSSHRPRLPCHVSLIWRPRLPILCRLGLSSPLPPTACLEYFFGNDFRTFEPHHDKESSPSVVTARIFFPALRLRGSLFEITSLVVSPLRLPTLVSSAKRRPLLSPLRISARISPFVLPPRSLYFSRLSSSHHWPPSCGATVPLHRHSPERGLLTRLLRSPPPFSALTPMLRPNLCHPPLRDPPDTGNLIPSPPGHIFLLAHFFFLPN